jgi:lysozyme family protein
MKDFEQALDFCIRHEATYARGHYGDIKFVVSENEDGDPGGLTKFGIDQRSHPDVDVENLTLEGAREIYFKEYWERAHCAEMAWPLSQVHFDGSVNTGIGQQTKFIQRTANVTADGAWGPATKKALIETVNDIGAVEVARKVCDQKEAFYRKLAEDKPKLARFLDGWLNRLNDLRKDCGLTA